jgi:hypothetical protein
MSYWAPAQARQTDVDFLLRRSREPLAVEVKAPPRFSTPHWRDCGRSANCRGSRDESSYTSGESAENGRRDRCLTARSFHSGRSRWLTLASSDDRPRAADRSCSGRWRYSKLSFGKASELVRDRARIP